MNRANPPPPDKAEQQDREREERERQRREREKQGGGQQGGGQQGGDRRTIRLVLLNQPSGGR